MSLIAAFCDPYVSHITQWGTLEDISEIALGGIKTSRIYPPDTETKADAGIYYRS